MKEPNTEQAGFMSEYQAKSAELLKARDEFIFTVKHLLKDEVPLVFMGVHAPSDKLLEKDYLISIIYRLPFGSGAIYNVRGNENTFICSNTHKRRPGSLSKDGPKEVDVLGEDLWKTQGVC